jgi:hypothetical protein
VGSESRGGGGFEISRWCVCYEISQNFRTMIRLWLGQAIGIRIPHPRESCGRKWKCAQDRPGSFPLAQGHRDSRRSPCVFIEATHGSRPCQGFRAQGSSRCKQTDISSNLYQGQGFRNSSRGSCG